MAKRAFLCKELMVKEIASRLKDAENMIVTNYKGLSAHEMDELRRELRSISAGYMVVKDSMAERALVEGANNPLRELIQGDVGIAFNKSSDPTEISKIISRFSKQHEVLKIRGGVINGEMLSDTDILSLALLPSREVLLGTLANALNAPLQGFASATSAILTKFLYALDAVKEKREREPDATASTKEAVNVDKGKEEAQLPADPGQTESAGDNKKEEQNG